MTKTTYRWLAKRIFEATSFGSYTSNEAAWFSDKAREVVKAQPTTAEQVSDALVNFPSMRGGRLDSSRRNAMNKILTAMVGREFVDELVTA